MYKKFGKSKEIKKTCILDLIGSTPLVYLPKLSKATGSEIYVIFMFKAKVKCEFLNPFGSSKDRAVKKMIE